MQLEKILGFIAQKDPWIVTLFWLSQIAVKFIAEE
jgi:hypothetical protein